MLSTEREWLFKLLGRIAEGIVAVAGQHCEVVVHDFTDLEHAAVAISGNLSGRKLGAPIPDLDFIAKGLNDNSPDQLNYTTRKNDQQYQSSTIWVRDPQGKIIGAICINMDYKHVLQMKTIIDSLAAVVQQDSELVVSNTFARDLDELLHNTVVKFLQNEAISSIEDLTLSDKERLIEIVEQRGLFSVRGAAQRLADILNVSRASIYNYRGSAKTKQDPDTMPAAV